MTISQKIVLSVIFEAAALYFTVLSITINNIVAWTVTAPLSIMFCALGLYVVLRLTIESKCYLLKR